MMAGRIAAPRTVADPADLRRDERHMLAAAGKGHIVVAETGAIWYAPRPDSRPGYDNGDGRRRVDGTVRALECAGLVRIVELGPCELTKPGEAVLAGLGGV